MARMGTWPVKTTDQFQTTCSQCHTHIATETASGPVICPRCKATIEAADGQPFGTPPYVSPLSGETLAHMTVGHPEDDDDAVP